MDKMEEQPECSELMEAESVNPLKFDHVLSYIFTHCSQEEIKTCRCVCKQWNKLGTRILKKSQPTIVFSEEGFKRGKLSKLMNVLKKSKDPPVVNFEISSSFCIAVNEDLILSFFSICRNFIESLTICVDRNKSSFMELTENYLKSTTIPKLKCLVFQDETKERGNRFHNIDDVVCHNFFKALVAAAVNLERLDLSFPSKFIDGDQHEDSPYIPDGLILTKPPQLLNHLELSARISDDQLLCLAKVGLQLKTLHFRLRNSPLKQSSFKALLQSQSETLSDLMIIEERQGSHFTVEFPKMSNLTIFSLFSTSEVESNIVSFAPFGYKEHLPKIDKLVLWNAFGNNDRLKPFLKPTSPSLSMRNLELPRQFRDVETVNSLSLTFPQLTNLKISFALRPQDEQILQTIFATMKSLEKLDVRTDMDQFNQNIDHIFTGISIDKCRRVLKDHINLTEIDLTTVKRKPGLIDLKNLKRLDITLENSRPPFITDLTAYLAFMKMEKLKHLRFTPCGVSSDCIEELRRKFHVRVIPSTGRNFYEFEYIDIDFD